MSLITREELDRIKIKLAECDIFGTAANFIVLDVLEEASPDKLMAHYEKRSVLSHCKIGRNLEGMYDFSSKEAAIELQFPELWEQHVKWKAAQAEMEKLATFLDLPNPSEEF